MKRKRRYSRHLRRNCGCSKRRMRRNSPASCKMCGGQLALLGDLGNLRHVRCVNCGAQYSIKRRIRWRKKK